MQLDFVFITSVISVLVGLLALVFPILNLRRASRASKLLVRMKDKLQQEIIIKPDIQISEEDIRRFVDAILSDKVSDEKAIHKSPK